MSSPEAFEEQAAGFLTYTAVGLVILGLIVAVWFLVKCFELVVRVLVLHPDCKPLLVSLSAFLLLLALLSVTHAQSHVVNIFTGVSFLMLLLVAKIVEIYYDELFQPERDRQAVVSEVLDEPWWNAA